MKPTDTIERPNHQRLRAIAEEKFYAGKEFMGPVLIVSHEDFRLLKDEGGPAPFMDVELADAGLMNIYILGGNRAMAALEDRVCPAVPHSCVNEPILTSRRVLLKAAEGPDWGVGLELEPISQDEYDRAFMIRIAHQAVWSRFLKRKGYEWTVVDSE